jgi:hypothetical protein
MTIAAGQPKRFWAVTSSSGARLSVDFVVFLIKRAIFRKFSENLP